MVRYLLILFVLVITKYFLVSQPAPISTLSALTGEFKGSINLSWIYPGPTTLPSGSSYYIQYSSYDVVWSTANAQITLSTGPVSLGEQQFYRVPSLILGTTYFFRVWISSAGLFSKESNGATNYAQVDLPPAKINDLSLTPKFRALILNWTSPGDDNIYLDLLNSTFTIKYSSTTSVWDSMQNTINIPTNTSPAIPQTFLITGLINWTTYYVLVRTIDQAGNISEDSNLTFTYPRNSIPDSFTMLEPNKLIALTPIVTFYWSQARDPDAEYGDYISSYTVLCSSTRVGWDILPPIIFSTVTIHPLTTTYLDISGAQWLENTTYYFRVFAYDSESLYRGGVGDLAGLWFAKNLVQEPPTDFSLLFTSGSLHGPGAREPAFDWTDSQDPDPGDKIAYYKLEVSSFPTFTTIDFSFTLSTSSYEPPDNTFAENATYYWRVLAFDTFGASTTSSNIFKFLTNEENSRPLREGPLLLLTTPQNATIITTNTPTFEWTGTYDPDPDDYITEYYVFYSFKSTDPFVQNFAISSWTSVSPLQTSYTPLPPLDPLIENATYWWGVAAYDYNHVEKKPQDSKTDIWYFRVDTVNDPPLEFLLLHPSGTISNLKPTFSWQNTYDPDPLDDGATIAYTLDISTYPDFTYICISTTTFSTSYSLTTETLINKTTYHWRVKATSERGFLSTFSLTWTLYTYNKPPTKPILLSPAGLAGVPIRTSTPTFEWSISTDPEGDPLIYKLIYYTVGISTSIILQTTYYGVPLTEKLLENKKYLWYVTAIDSIGNETSSSIEEFWVNAIDEPPYKPTLTSPSNNSFVISVSTLLVWNKNIPPDDSDGYEPDPDPPIPGSQPDDPGEVWYYVRLSSDPKIFTPLLSNSSGKDNTYTTPSLQENTTYYWFIEARNGTNLSNFSSTFTFITNIVEEFPKPFTVIYPTHNSILQTRAVDFQWTPTTDPDPFDHIIYYLHITEYYPFDTPSPVGYTIIRTTNSYLLTLKDNSKYTFYVVADDTTTHPSKITSSTGIVSHVITFYINTQDEPPSDFDLITPSGVVRSLQPTFKWNMSNNIDPFDEIQYNFYLGSNDTLASSKLKLTTTYYEIDAVLTEGVTYWWYVEAFDKQKNKKISNQTFYLLIDGIQQPPRDFSLISPSGTIKTTSPNFLWQLTSDPDYGDYVTYELRLSTYHNFIFYFSTQTKLNEFSPPPLRQNTSYYWFVIAKDSLGLATTSQIFSFYIPPLFIPSTPKNLKAELHPPTIYGRFHYLIPVKLTWSKVTTYTNNQPISTLKGYLLYRSTDCYNFTYYAFTEIEEFTESILQPINRFTYYYYYIKSQTLEDIESESSEIISIFVDEKPTISYASTDGTLIVSLPENVNSKLKQEKYKLHIEMETPNKYNILLVAEDTIIRKYQFDSPLILLFRYQEHPPDLKPSIFYFNGIEDIYIQPEINEVDKTAKIKSSNIGTYTLKYLTLPTEFRITKIVPPKIFTPYDNAEPELKEIKFYFSDPPEHTDPICKIYHFDGTFVKEIKRTPGNNILAWDGKYDTGEYVPKGIYLYEIIDDNKLIHTGTVIVAR